MKKRSSVRSRLKRFYKFWSRITFELVITVHINREQFVSIQYNKSKISNDTIAHKRYFTFCQPLHKKIRRNFRIIFLILHAWHVTQDQKKFIESPDFWACYILLNNSPVGKSWVRWDKSQMPGIFSIHNISQNTNNSAFLMIHSLYAIVGVLHHLNGVYWRFKLITVHVLLEFDPQWCQSAPFCCVKLPWRRILALNKYY